MLKSISGGDETILCPRAHFCWNGRAQHAVETFLPASSRSRVHQTHPLRFHSSQARHVLSSHRKALSAPDGPVASLLLL